MATMSPTKPLAKRGLAALISVLLVSGCVVGPEYLKPDVPMPNDFRSQISPSQATSFADLPWWNVFNDQTLQALINEAVAHNYDLQAAVARIEEARAQVGQVEAEGRPQIGYDASAVGEKGFVPQLRGGAGTLTYGVFTGLLTAAWEFDIWGRIRHATDAAKANMLAQEDVRRGVVLTLVSDVASDYFKLLELDRELAIAQESSRVYKSTLDLFTLRFEAGKDSRLPVERAQAAYQSSIADIQDLKRRIAQQENAISILVGAYPRTIARGRTLIEQTTPATPLGSTTALLQRRPDILASEQVMIGANAQIGEAVADFFPRIGLSTFLGGQGVNLANVWSSFGVWNVALALAGPIYSGGRLEEAYHERQAFWDESVAHYKQIILVAFQETSDALIAQRTLGERHTALKNQVQALQHSSDIALLRYEAGRASYFEVLEAQQQLFPAQDAQAQNERDQLLAVVNLYKALGGGWSANDTGVTPPTVNAVNAPAPAGG
jgi:multidrug efflux system outer membrane protein